MQWSPNLIVSCIQESIFADRTGMLLSVIRDDYNEQFSIAAGSVQEAADLIEDLARVVPGRKRVIIPANYRNSALIAYLALRCPDSDSPLFWIGKPCYRRNFENYPEFVNRVSSLPPSVGGLQPISAWHHPVFGLADILWKLKNRRMDPEQAAETALELYDGLPLRSLTSFFYPGCRFAHALLAGMIRDPRWQDQGKKVSIYSRRFAVAHPDCIAIMQEDKSLWDMRTLVVIRCWLGELGFNGNDLMSFNIRTACARLESIPADQPPSVFVAPLIHNGRVTSQDVYQNCMFFIDMVRDFWKGCLFNRMEEFFWPEKYDFLPPAAKKALRLHLHLMNCC